MFFYFEYIGDIIIMIRNFLRSSIMTSTRMNQDVYPSNFDPPVRNMIVVNEKSSGAQGTPTLGDLRKLTNKMVAHIETTRMPLPKAVLPHEKYLKHSMNTMFAEANKLRIASCKQIIQSEPQEWSKSERRKLEKIDAKLYDIDKSMIAIYQHFYNGNSRLNGNKVEALNIASMEIQLYPSRTEQEAKDIQTIEECILTARKKAKELVSNSVEEETLMSEIKENMNCAIKLGLESKLLVIPANIREESSGNAGNNVEYLILGRENNIFRMKEKTALYILQVIESIGSEQVAESIQIPTGTLDTQSSSSGMSRPSNTMNDNSSSTSSTVIRNSNRSLNSNSTSNNKELQKQYRSVVSELKAVQATGPRTRPYIQSTAV